MFGSVLFSDARDIGSARLQTQDGGGEKGVAILMQAGTGTGIPI